MQLVWHRGDLRTHDHPALAAAVAEGPTLGVVIREHADERASASCPWPRPPLEYPDGALLPPRRASRLVSCRRGR